MSLNFEKYAQKGTEFIKEVAAELGTPNDLDHAGRVIMSVFHTLREKITAEESIHLISQLPMYLKAVYIDGWKLSKSAQRIKTLEEFLVDVRSQSNRTAGRDFGDNEHTRKAIEAVFKVIRKHVTGGELEHVKAQLPEPIAELWEA